MPTVEPIQLEGGPLVHLRPVPRARWTTGWFAAWVAYYAEKPYTPPAAAAVQVVVADVDGRFPWDAGCDETMAASQPTPATISSTEMKCAHPASLASDAAAAGSASTTATSAA